MRGSQDITRPMEQTACRKSLYVKAVQAWESFRPLLTGGRSRFLQIKHFESSFLLSGY